MTDVSDRAEHVESPGSISLIIPCWTDITDAIERARVWADDPNVHEVIIATVSHERLPKIDSHDIKICAASEPGRGGQLYLGASLATGQILLFQHVDSELSSAQVAALVKALRDPKIVGGAFYRKFDERHPLLLWAEGIERWHSRTFGALYGDQGIFVRRDHFLCLGGFASIPLMEDVEFSLRLRRSGKIALLDPPMSSSPAKQIEQGAWRTTLRNMLFLILFRCGVPATFLHQWYYRRVKKNASEVVSLSEHDGYGNDELTPLEADTRT